MKYLLSVNNSSSSCIITYPLSNNICTSYKWAASLFNKSLKLMLIKWLQNKLLALQCLTLLCRKSNT